MFLKTVTICSLFVIVFISNISLQVAVPAALADEASEQIFELAASTDASKPTKTPTPTRTATPTLTPTVTPTSTPSVVAGVHGIYAIDTLRHTVGQPPPVHSIDPAVLSDPEVDGVSLQMAWRDVEPADGTYSWATLDGYIAEAAGASKKIQLKVMPGYETPAWVYAEGAQSFRFVWDKNWGPALCSVQSMPLPWDPIFLEKWRSLIRALGRHYSANTTVIGMKITGVNSLTEETNVPYSVDEAISDGTTSCTGPNYIKLWQDAGYTRKLIVSSWLKIAQAYQASFPATEIVAMLQPFGFPPIDDSGNLFVNPKGDPYASNEIAADGVADFPNQFGLQNNGLSNKWISTLVEGYANQVSTGYQEINPLGAKLPIAMSLATSAGADYLELYENDLFDPSLTADIEDARALLLAN